MGRSQPVVNHSPHPSLSIASANLLYLSTILLMLTLGSMMQTWHLTWGLIASEVLLVLLPAIALLRQQRIPLRVGLRLQPIRPLVALLCVALGFAVFLFSIIIDVLMAQLTGMPSVPLPVESMPSGTLEFAGFFLALAVFAPLCEEGLFRGAIQGAYEKRRSPAVTITAVALMFAFFHMRLSGLPGLLPAAFALGYVAWRTRSIYASVLLHFGLNAPSAIHSLLALNGGQGLPFLGLPAAAAGLVATPVLIYAIRRLQPPRAQEPPALPDEPRRLAWLREAWPLAAAGLIYLWVAGETLMTLTGAGLITLEQAGYDRVTITETFESRFRITNRAGDAVGELTCTIAPRQVNVGLDCAGHVSAYDVTVGSSHFKDGDHDRAWSATWDPNTMDLLAFTFERSYESAGSRFHVVVQDGQLVTESSAGRQAIALSPDTLVEYEWAWRTNALRPQVFTSIQAPFAYLSAWDEQAEQSRPVFKSEVLRLYGSQPLTLPTGPVQAQKSALGGQSAWYTAGNAGPVRLDDGMLVYELVK